MIGGHLLLFFGDDHGAALSAHHDFILGRFHIVHVNHVLVGPGSQQRPLVDQVGQIGTGETGSRLGNHFEIDVFSQRYLARMNLQDLETSFNIGARNNDLTVKTARTQQRRVEDIWTVGRRDQDNPFVRLESIHLDQQLVEGLLTFHHARRPKPAPR